MSQATSLYRFYDTNGQLLYVGIAAHFPSRAASHDRIAKWHQRAATATITHFPTREEAIDAERAAILAEQPQHNSQYAPRRAQRSSRPRRPRGTGSVSQRMDGLWVAVTSSGSAPRIRVYTYFATEEEALAHLA